MCDKQKDINGDNSPTVPQEKRVVPLLMVWMSRCGGRKIGADSQNKQKKFMMFVLKPQSNEKFDINFNSAVKSNMYVKLQFQP